jgi:predicted nucleotide-binding protein
MANRRTPQSPSIEPKVFTSRKEIEDGITKLQRRIQNLEELSSLVSQNLHYNDQKVRNVESNIRSTIQEVFGSNSPEFYEHRSHSILYGYSNMGDSEYERQQKFVEGIPQSKAMLEGLIARLEEKKLDFSPPERKNNPIGDSVFLVHGHNEAVRETVARFLEHLDLRVTILHEQPNRGRTINEKFEDHSQEAGFSVILLTGDDRGGAKEQEPSTYLLRARQNVILELGFFLGVLTRSRVCALYEEGVEIPSDYHGVLFIKLDSDWKLKLARELKVAGLPVDLNKVM